MNFFRTTDATDTTDTTIWKPGFSGYALDGCNTAVLSNYSFFFLPVLKQKFSALIISQLLINLTLEGFISAISLAMLHNTNLINVKCYDVKRYPSQFCD